jgi:DNA topoisomerase-1
VKYARLGGASPLAQHVDRDKFERARRLVKRLPAIMASAEATMRHGVQRQLATCLWLLGRTAIRIGSDDHDAPKSRRFGLTTLQVRHATPGPGGRLELDFVGKDAVRYRRVVRLGSAAAHANIVRFRAGKAPTAPLFDAVTPARFNDYLGTFMEGLTAKVVRTCMASATYEAVLQGTRTQDSRFALLMAGARVAVLLNHRKGKGAGPGAAEASNDAIEAELDAAKDKAALKEVIARHGLSLSTARVNYIDPRIAATFCATHGLPLSAALPGTLQRRFAWAAKETRFVFAPPGA